MGRSRGDKRFHGGMPVNRDSGLAEADEVNDGEEDRIHQSVQNQSSVRPDMYPEPNSMSDVDKGGEDADR